MRVAEIVPLGVDLVAGYKQNSVRLASQYLAACDSTIRSAADCAVEVVATPKPKPVKAAEAKRRKKVRMAWLRCGGGSSPLDALTISKFTRSVVDLRQPCL